MRRRSTSNHWPCHIPFERSLATALLATWTMGCALSHFDGTHYRHGDLVFTVGEKPVSWRPLRGSGALLAYQDNAAGTTIAVHGRCGKDGDDVPLEALTHHLFIHFTERDIVDQRRVPMDGREALRTEMVAKLDGVPRRFVVFVLKKDGCVYDFLHIGGTSSSRSSEEAFDAYVSRFRTGRR